MPKTQLQSGFQAQQDESFLLQTSESCVFMACCVMLNELRTLTCAFKDGELSQRAFFERANAALARLAETAAATERFNIVLPVMDHGRFSPFFWRWFNWWDDYFKELTPGQIGHIEKLMREQNPEVADHRPKDDWLTYRHTPGFTLVIA
jgi:hypothetical protein